MIAWFLINFNSNFSKMLNFSRRSNIKPFLSYILKFVSLRLKSITYLPPIWINQRSLVPFSARLATGLVTSTHFLRHAIRNLYYELFSRKNSSQLHRWLWQWVLCWSSFVVVHCRQLDMCVGLLTGCFKDGTFIFLDHKTSHSRKRGKILWSSKIRIFLQFV